MNIINLDTDAKLKSIYIRENEFGLIYVRKILCDVLAAGNYNFETPQKKEIYIVKSGELFDISIDNYEILTKQYPYQLERISIDNDILQICLL